MGSEEIRTAIIRYVKSLNVGDLKQLYEKIGEDKLDLKTRLRFLLPPSLLFQNGSTAIYFVYNYDLTIGEYKFEKQIDLKGTGGRATLIIPIFTDIICYKSEDGIIIYNIRTEKIIKQIEFESNINLRMMDYNTYLVIDMESNVYKLTISDTLDYTLNKIAIEFDEGVEILPHTISGYKIKDKYVITAKFDNYTSFFLEDGKLLYNDADLGRYPDIEQNIDDSSMFFYINDRSGYGGITTVDPKKGSEYVASIHTDIRYPSIAYFCDRFYMIRGEDPNSSANIIKIYLKTKTGKYSKVQTFKDATVSQINNDFIFINNKIRIYDPYLNKFVKYTGFIEYPEDSDTDYPIIILPGKTARDNCAKFLAPHMKRLSPSLVSIVAKFI